MRKKPANTKLNMKDTKVCAGECGKSKSIVNYYLTDSNMFPDGKVPICKACIKKDIAEGGIESVKKLLRQIDKPFIVQEWNKCVSSGNEPFGWYMRQINSLPNYKGMGYEDSVGADEKVFATYGDMAEEELFGEPTVEVRRKWGLGYTPKEYYELEHMWVEMIESNEIETPQHKKQLKTYCQLAILLDRAIETGNSGEITKLNTQFMSVSKDSGFRPIDRKSGSESAGIRSFSVIFEEVERDGFIEPYKIEEYQDIVDKTIMYLANYTRKILQMEQLIEPPDDTPKVDGDWS